MLIGEYRHTIDDKRRISLPAKFRKEIGSTVVITHGLDNCLFIFSLEAWGKVVGKMETLSLGESNARAFGRYLFAGAADVDTDSLGRILVPEYLAASIGLNTEERAVLIGVQTRLELWSESNWDAYKRSIESRANDVAENLGALGFI